MSYQKSVAIQRMNEYGKNKIPFLFVIDFDMKQPIILRLSEIDPAILLFNINGKRNYNIDLKSGNPISFERHPINIEEYKVAFEKVRAEINAGNTYLLNLTFPTKINTNLTLEQIFYLSHAEYKLFYKDKFVVFSPESFVKISDGIISSFPMKGTIDASIENAEQVILNDPKEIAEHNTIVDLIRNDLSMIAKNVRVEKFRYVEKITTTDKSLLQVSSKIIGRLENDFNSKLGEIIFDLLPAGSVSGAPKKKTVEIINESEIYSRGFYTGVFGYYDGFVLDSGVMIRFIEKTKDGLIYKSGGGITCMSNPESEYQELIDKVYVPIA
jgi:para-aminobenzoate synthetase component 1